MKTIQERVNEERRLYYKHWRAANKDKVKKHNTEYWIRRAEKKRNEKEECK